ncbi:MAG: trypsin-like peptidase domain-containing protein [Candidatus Eremiobacteraeota bacterium]|nr:trypsin-like peptidase domain-containing protein [Candidatus Eremiobacteraeota bacterium]
MKNPKFPLVVIILALLYAVAPAQEEERRVKAIAAARPSVVSIRTYKESGGEPGIGSGVIIRSNGLILTNHHVVRDADVIKVTTVDEKDYTAQVLHLAPQHDIALLKINGNGFRAARIGSSAAVKLGQSAIAIGDPLGFSSTVTLGTVGGLKRSVKLNDVDYQSLIQTDAAINPGSSGGALIDLDGKLIGINTLVYTGPARWKRAQGIGFAIAIDHAMMVANALMQRTPERVTSKPWLGVTGSTITKDLSDAYGLGAKRGILVRTVLPASPAEKAGIRPGDVITRANGELLTGLQDLSEMLSGMAAGDVMTLDMLRTKKAFKVEVTLDVSSR